MTRRLMVSLALDLLSGLILATAVAILHAPTSEVLR